MELAKHVNHPGNGIKKALVYHLFYIILIKKNCKVCSQIVWFYLLLGGSLQNSYLIKSLITFDYTFCHSSSLPCRVEQAQR